MSSPPSPNEVNDQTDHDANDDVDDNVNDNVTNNSEAINENEVSSNINSEEFSNSHAIEPTSVETNENNNQDDDTSNQHDNNTNNEIYNIINEGNTNAVEESEAITDTDNPPQPNLSNREMLNYIWESEVNNFIAGFQAELGIESGITATNDRNNNNESPESINMPNKQQEEEPSTNKIEVLLCAHCKHPIASNREILRARADDAWRDQVYCYELDLFENEKPVWAYSATNPSSVRFDVVRISPYIHTQRPAMPYSSFSSTEFNKPNDVIDKTLHKNDVELTNKINIVDNHNNADESVEQVNTCTTTISDKEINEQDNAATDKQTNEMIESRKVNDCISCVFSKGSYSSEHPFFVGYDWCFCHCINCGYFLGWGFAKHDKVVDAMKAVEEEKAQTQNKKKKNYSRRKKQRKMEQIRNSNNNHNNNSEEESAIASAAADAMRRYEENNDNDNYDYETHSGAYNTLINPHQTETATENNNNSSNNEEEVQEENITEEEHVETLNLNLNTAIQSNGEEEEHSELTAVNDHAHSEQEQREENQEDIEEELEEGNDDDDDEEEEEQRGEEDLLQQTKEEKVQKIIKQMYKIAHQRKAFHTTPTPDFIGLIVTHCTGTNDYDENLYNKVLLLANVTFTKNFIMTYFNKEFRRLLDSLHDYRLEHILFNKYLSVRSVLLDTWRAFASSLNNNSGEATTSHSVTNNVNVEADNVINLHVNNTNNNNQEEEETHEYSDSREEEVNIASTNAVGITPELPDRQNENQEMKKENNNSKYLEREEREIEALKLVIEGAIDALQDFYNNCLNFIDRWTSNVPVRTFSAPVNDGILSLFSTASLITLLSDLENNEHHEEHDTNNNTNEEENGNNYVDAYEWIEVDIQEVGEEPLVSHSSSEEHHQQHNVNAENNNDEDTLNSNEQTRNDSDDSNTIHTPLSAVSSNDSSQSFEGLF